MKNGEKEERKGRYQLGRENGKMVEYQMGEREQNKCNKIMHRYP